MLSLGWLTVLGLPIILVLHYSWSFHKNIQIAKASGIPYVLVPVSTWNHFWAIFSAPVLRLIDKLPTKWTLPWRYLIQPDWSWYYRHEPFAMLGSDTFITVSPRRLFMFTCDPDVITQITTRRADFPKPVYIYAMTNIYGKNVVASEGADWRHQRKLTSPPFTEKNNVLVWNETFRQTENMLGSWVAANGAAPKTITQVAQDTMRLSLHVISRAAFNQHMHWPKPSSTGDAFSNDEAPDGYTMSFTLSMHYLLNHIIPIIALPKWFLRYSPFQTLRRCYEAYEQWGKHMRNAISDKRWALKSGSCQSSDIDILGQLIKDQAGEQNEKVETKAALSDSEVMGNAFVFTLAGHETTGNSIHFSLMFLALNPQTQKKVQDDLEDIFQGRPISEWDYERDIPRLFGGMVGAVLNEELRLIPPVGDIPKSVGTTPQSLVVDGKKCVLPPNMLIGLCTAATHRNPRFWPSGPSKKSEDGFFPPCNVDNDLEEFKPERWLKSSRSTSPDRDFAMPTDHGKSSDTDDLGINTAADTSETLYRPVKGSFIPFSEGYRACLGRRFAQVEVLTALAVIFTQYSLELAVDEWASDEEVAKMTRQEKREIWKKAEEKANGIWQGKMGSMISLQIRGAHVPFRIVKKGEERFRDLED